MSTAPVAVLLLFNGLLLIGAHFLFDKAHRHRDSLLFSLLFLGSGMPALIYQIVWQRVLFSIYGVNSQSVVVVVTAFMVGLGIGSLAGGRLSARFPRLAVLIFGIAELGVAAFGLSSLRIFQWAAAHTAGANLPFVIVFSLLLLLFPTVPMGATLPLLVEHLVLHTNRVGPSVSTLYFANTFGSAIACYFCATFLLRDFGQSGSVSIAACLNGVVGGAAYLYARRDKQELGNTTGAISPTGPELALVSLNAAMLLGGRPASLLWDLKSPGLGFSRWPHRTALLPLHFCCRPILQASPQVATCLRKERGNASPRLQCESWGFS